jgi:hydroxymethylglutaryl-CoA reductase (NADPH)
MPPSATVVTAVPTASNTHEILHRQVDMGSPAVVSALSSLSSSHSPDADVIARVSAPIFIRVVPSPESSPETEGPQTSTHLVMLDSFMNAWSSLIGDPIVSKWIVITLAVSVFLNWYLLKGLASPLPLPFPSMVTFPSASTSGAPRMSRRWSGVGAADLASYERERLAEAENQGIAIGRPIPLAVEIPESRRFPRSYGQTGPNVPAFEQDVGDETEQMCRASPSQSEVSSATGPQTPPPFAGPANQLPPMIQPSPHITATGELNVADRLEAMVREVIPENIIGITPINDSELGIGRRSLKELCELYAENPVNAKQMNNEEIVMLGQDGKLPAYSLEKVLGDFERAVRIRRALICEYIFIVCISLSVN